MTTATMDFDTGMDDRLRQALAELPHRRQLDPAVKLAGAQLELLKPAVLSPQSDGRMYIGPAAHVPRGCVVIVLADRKRVATLYLMACEERIAIIEDAVTQVRERVGDTPVDLNGAMIAANAFLQRYGGKPGGTTPAAPVASTAGMVGILFAVFSDEQRRMVLASIERVAAENVCPVLVGLFGKGSSDHPDSHSGAWPILLPLAPYMSQVVPRQVEQGRR